VDLLIVELTTVIVMFEVDVKKKTVSRWGRF